MKHRLLKLLSAVLLATGASPAVVSPPAAAAAPAECARRPVGLIAEKWRSLNGANGPLGCPLGPERVGAGGRGRVNTFERGEIVWSPEQGANMMVALYRRNGDLVIDWGRTMPFKYDFFQVRWDLNGRNVGQREIRGRVQGSTVVSRPPDGTYTAVVQGCDSRFLSSSRCRQKWTVPVSIQLPFPRHPAGSGGTYLVVNQHSKMCVDVAYGSRDPGARVQQYTCHGGPPERWRYDVVKVVNKVGYFQIVNENSGLCLSIRGNVPAVGAQPTQARCNGRVSQLWGNIQAGDNIQRLVPYLDSSLCLDDEGFNTTPGASIQLWKCNGLAVQGWTHKRQ